MARLLEFATHHPGLMSAFFTVLLMLIWTLIKGATGNALSPAQSVLLLNRRGSATRCRAAPFRAAHAHTMQILVLLLIAAFVAYTFQRRDEHKRLFRSVPGAPDKIP